MPPPHPTSGLGHGPKAGVGFPLALASSDAETQGPPSGPHPHIPSSQPCCYPGFPWQAPGRRAQPTFPRPGLSRARCTGSPLLPSVGRPRGLCWAWRQAVSHGHHSRMRNCSCLEVELGLAAASSHNQERRWKEQCCAFSGSRCPALSGKRVPPAAGTGHLSHSLPLAWRGAYRCAALTPLGEDSTPCPALAPSSYQLACRVAPSLGTGGLRSGHVALNLCPYLLPRNPSVPSCRGALSSDMLGLEVVRLRALLESSHQALLLQQCSIHWLQLGWGPGFMGDRQVRPSRWGMSTCSPALSWMSQSQLQGKAALTAPALARLP